MQILITKQCEAKVRSNLKNRTHYWSVHISFPQRQPIDLLLMMCMHCIIHIRRRHLNLQFSVTKHACG
jgi:hypothetical protein